MKFKSENYLKTVLREYFPEPEGIIISDHVHPSVGFVRELYEGEIDIPYGELRFTHNKENGSRTVYFFSNIRKGITISCVTIGYSDEISPVRINSLDRKIHVKGEFAGNSKTSIQCLLEADDLCLDEGIASIVIDDGSENRGIYHINMCDTSEYGGPEGKPVIKYYDGVTLDALKEYCSTSYIDGEDVQKKRKKYERMTGLWQWELEKIGFVPDKVCIFEKKKDLNAHELFAKTLATGSREKFDAWIKTVFEEKEKKTIK